MKTGLTFAAALLVFGLLPQAGAAGAQPGRLSGSVRGGTGSVFGALPPGLVPGWASLRDLGGPGWNTPAHAPGRHGGRHGRYGHGYGYGNDYPYLGGWGEGLIEDPEAFRDAGFFSGSADSWVEGGQVVYDYDRGYPYDWYRDPPARTAVPIALARPGRGSRVSCDVETAGVRVCRGSGR